RGCAQFCFLSFPLFLSVLLAEQHEFLSIQFAVIEKAPTGPVHSVRSVCLNHRGQRYLLLLRLLVGFIGSKADNPNSPKRGTGRESKGKHQDRYICSFRTFDSWELPEIKRNSKKCKRCYFHNSRPSKMRQYTHSFHWRQDFGCFAAIPSFWFSW